MRFGEPIYLWGLLLAPALVVFIIWADRNKTKVKERFGNLKLILQLSENFSPRRARWKKILLVSSVVLLVLGLARPQWGSKLVQVKKQGLDIIFALDVSLSMLAEDIQPNRLERAKLEIHDFLDKLKGDRVGLVTFAGAAYISCPLTMDYRAAQLFLDNIEAGIITKPGTDIAEAINTAALAFNQKEKKYKVLVLVTDGEDQGHQPAEAAKKAAAEGIRIYTIGIGTPAGEPIPLRQPEGTFLGYKKDESGSVVLSRLDEQTLSEIAQIGRGKCLSVARGGFDLDKIYQEISGLEKKELQGTLAVEYLDRYQYFLFPAIMLLIMEMFLTDRRRTQPLRFKIWKKSSAAVAATLLLFAFTASAWGKGNANSLNSEGNELYNQGKYQEATRRYQDAAIEKPESFVLQYNLANALQQSQDYARALQSYQRALELGDTSQLASAFYNLGNGLYRIGQYQEAAAAYKQTLELDPSDQDAKYNFELALKKLQEQSSQQQQKQKKQDQKQNQQQNQSNQQNQENQKQQQPEQDNSQMEKQEQQKQEQKQQQSKEKPSQSQLNKQEAERILEALDQKEREQKQQKMTELQKKLVKEGREGKDW